MTHGRPARSVSEYSKDRERDFRFYFSSKFIHIFKKDDQSRDNVVHAGWIWIIAKQERDVYACIFCSSKQFTCFILTGKRFCLFSVHPYPLPLLPSRFFFVCQSRQRFGYSIDLPQGSNRTCRPLLLMLHRLLCQTLATPHRDTPQEGREGLALWHS